jgi:enamine deaminase RidA (YjgF/YER057c/UK114 family)
LGLAHVLSTRGVVVTERIAVVPDAHQRAAADARYSPAVRAGNIVFLSGQIGRDGALEAIADPLAQYRAAFANVQLVLNEAGADLCDVVELMTFHTSFDDFDVFRQVKDDYFTSEPYPAWTAVGVTSLAVPGILVEIRCTAVLDSPAGP